MINKKGLKLAYIHSMEFPTNEANAFDAVWTASALAEVADTTFIVKSIRTSKADLNKYYYVPETFLRFISLGADHIPDRLLARIRDYYAKFVLACLRFHPRFSLFKGVKVLYARDPRLLRYIGLQRPKQKWLRDWILIYESHDPLGLTAEEIEDKDPFMVNREDDNSRPRQMLKAAGNFDAIICNTRALAEDLKTWTNGLLDPYVIDIASPLPRLENPPQVIFGEKIVVGYIGTIDTFRGVDILIKSLAYLPDNYLVRVIGRFRQEQGVDPGWLQKLLDDPRINEKMDLQVTDHIPDVATEIDRCNIMVQPASNHIMDSRYATPQKAYGYMVRGKPIVAADVACHRELFKDNMAVYYQLAPEELAKSIVHLVQNPDIAQKIAVKSWEDSVNFTYQRRAKEILGLINDINFQK